MKTYRFVFTSLPAEFNNGMVAIIFDTKLRYQEVRNITLAEAKAYLPEFLKKVEPGPAQVYISCYSNPKPRGWKQMKRTLDKLE